MLRMTARSINHNPIDARHHVWRREYIPSNFIVDMTHCTRTGPASAWCRSRVVVQAICAKKPPNRAKLSTSMKLTTMIVHHMETNFRYGATQKCRYFDRGGHICSAITAFLIFGYISTTNWLMTTKLVSNTMFSGSRIPMKQSTT